MANELQFYGTPESQSGLNINISLYNSLGVEVSTGIQSIEVSNNAIYLADMPNVPADNYIVRFFNGSNFITQGNIDWDGENEIDYSNLIKETHQLLGFNKNIPMTATKNNITSGDIVINITGDCENVTTLNRQ